MVSCENDLLAFGQSLLGELEIGPVRQSFNETAAAELANRDARNRSRMASSLYRMPLTNWPMNTFQPAPAARRANPNAAVVFPLPSPV